MRNPIAVLVSIIKAMLNPRAPEAIRPLVEPLDQLLMNSAPDLTAASIVANLSTIQPGGAINVNYTLVSKAGAAKQSQTKLNLVNPNNVAQVLASTTFAEPAIGATTSSPRAASISIPSSVSPGVYQLRLIVDNQSSIGQSVTNNDIIAGPTITVAIPLTPPDLTATSITASQSTVKPGGALTVNYTLVSKAGAAKQSQTKLNLVNSNNVAQVLASATFTEASIGANTSSNRSATMSIPSSVPPGTYQLRLFVDNQSNIGQLVTSNDIIAGPTITVANPAATALTITTRAANGTLVAGVKLIRYNSAWQVIDNSISNASGQATWNTAPGTFNIEAYSPGGDFWASTTATVSSNTTTALSLQQAMPYETNLQVFNAATGAPVTGGNVPAGTQLRVVTTVKNATGSAQTVHVQLSAGINKSSPDFNQTSGDQLINAGGTSDFAFSFTPSTTGSISAMLKVLTRVGNFTPTDTVAWSPVVTVGGNGTNIDWNFISVNEGGQILVGYVPLISIGKSGVTIATGYDLGQRTAAQIQKLALPQSLRDKLAPYGGLQLGDAQTKLNQLPLQVTAEEATLIDQMSHAKVLGDIVQQYDASSVVKFTTLPTQAQTAIADFAFQYGPGFQSNSPTLTNFWNDLTTQKWSNAVTDLRGFQEYKPRMELRAALLEKIKI